MARPRKNKLTEEIVNPDVQNIEKEINSAINSPVVPSEPINSPVINATPVEIKSPEPINPDEQIAEKVDEKFDTKKILESIFLDVDRREMDRYFCVINTSTEAQRIDQAISHQRDLEMWGVHQYDKNKSRNSYARSFYFKDRVNAVTALQHALNLQKQV